VLHHEADVTPGPVAHPLLKIFAETGWALALARRRRLSCRPFPAALPITPALLAASFLAARAGPVLAAGLGPPPAPRRLAARFAAITRLRMSRPEQPLTALEQTTPRSMAAAVWPPLDVWETMPVVHGSLHSRCSSLEAKLALRFEALFTLRAGCRSLYQMCCSAIHPSRRVPEQSAKVFRLEGATDTGQRGSLVRG